MIKHHPTQENDLDLITSELNINIIEDTPVPPVPTRTSLILKEDLHLSSDSEEDLEATPNHQRDNELSPPEATTTTAKVDTNIDTVISDLKTDIDRLTTHKDALANVIPHLQDIHKNLDRVISLATIKNTFLQN